MPWSLMLTLVLRAEVDTKQKRWYPTNMNLQPTLKGEFLKLRPLEMVDFDNLYLAASDPLIWEQHPQSNRYQRLAFEKYFNEAIESKGALTILDAESSKIIGSSRYYDYNPQRKEIVIGATFLCREYWGGDYNRELKKLMLDHAFSFVDTVLFHVGEKNIRSQKALEKIGAKLSHKIEGKLIYARGPGLK